MTIRRDSVHFRILERLCAMPRPVRGISSAMLDRHFDAPATVEELAAAGLIVARGWADGPGQIWIPTDDGERLYHELAAAVREPPPAFQPVKVNSGSDPTRGQ
jgi:hypothetical protein